MFTRKFPRVKAKVIGVTKSTIDRETYHSYILQIIDGENEGRTATSQRKERIQFNDVGDVVQGFFDNKTGKIQFAPINWFVPVIGVTMLATAYFIWRNYFP